MTSADSLYKDVCVWVVTAAGCAVVAAFAAYFVMVVMRLIREMSRGGEPRKAAPPTESRCGCGGELGPVERVDASDARILEQRTCKSCERVSMVPRGA